MSCVARVVLIESLILLVLIAGSCHLSPTLCGTEDCAPDEYSAR